MSTARAPTRPHPRLFFQLSSLVVLIMVPAPVLATGTVRTIASNFTDSNFRIEINRNSVIAVPYHLNNQDGLLLSSTEAGITNSGPTPGRPLSAVISNWGLAVNAEGCGCGGIPAGVYVAPFGQSLQLIKNRAGYSNFSGLAMNDSGLISFLGRVNNTTGLNLAF